MSIYSRHFGGVRPMAALFLFAGVCGCVSVLPKTAPAAPRYVLGAPSFDGGSDPIPDQSVDWHLIIADSTSNQLLNSVKIPLSRSPNRYEFYAGLEWADRLPVLFQRALIRSFENTDGIQSVGDFTAVPVGDYTLKTDIRAFNTVYDNGNPLVEIDVYGRLMDKNGRLVAAEGFDTREPIDEDDPDLIMAGFDRASDDVLTRLVLWTFSEIQNTTTTAEM